MKTCNRLLSATAALLLSFASVCAQTKAPVNFDSVAPPDYREMFKMYMASQYDLLDDPEIALEYHTLFRMQRLEMHGQGGRQECFNLYNEVYDEFGGLDVRERIRPPLRQALGDAQNWSKTGVMKITATADLKPYDQSLQAFPLSLNIYSYGEGTNVATHPVVRPEDACFVRDRRAIYGLLPRAGRQHGFTIEYHGIGALSHLPISLAEGRAYIEAHKDAHYGRANREVNLEIIVRTEPIEIKNNQVLQVRAQVIAARLLDPDNNRELYVYAPAAPKKEKLASGPYEDDAIPLTADMITLYTLRDHPHFIDEDWVIEAVAGQIRGEQRRWKQLDQARERGHREFVYEWQKVEQENPELAYGALMDVFVRPERLWEFVRAEPAWDDRFTPLIEVFLFERDKIEGRNADFVARDLLPVWRRHFRGALKRLPERFWMQVQIAEPAYNHEAGYIDLAVGHFSKDKQPSKHLFPPIKDARFSVPPNRELSDAATTVHPDAARNGALYNIASIPRLNDRKMSRPIEMQYRNFMAPLQQEDGPELWRWSLYVFTSYGSSTPKSDAPIGFSYAETMVLDRWLKPTRIKASPEEAEALLVKMHGPSRYAIGDGKIWVRMVIRPSRVELAPRYKRRSETTDAQILFAALESVVVLNMLHELVVNFDAADFPSAASLNELLARDEAAERQKAETAQAQQARQAAAAAEQRAVVQARFAECGATPDMGSQSRCFDAMLNDRANLALTSRDLATLERNRRVIDSQRQANDHFSSVTKQMEQYAKCQQLGDQAAMYQCIAEVQAQQAADK